MSFSMLQEIFSTIEVVDWTMSTTVARHSINISSEASNWTNKWTVFCTPDTDVLCADIPISQCPSCSYGSFVVFAIFVVVLALSILAGNSLVIASVVSEDRSTRTNLGRIRASLATSDLFAGLLLLTVTIPNVMWTLSSTSHEIYVEWRRRKNTNQAVAGTIFFMVTLVTSLFHLAFLSYNRFSAIKWPLCNRNLQPRQMIHRLLLLWIAALAVATYPAWFPNYYDFAYIYFAFLYIPNISFSSESSSIYRLIAYGCILILIISYFAMTAFTIAAAVVLRIGRNQMRHITARSRDAAHKRERSAYQVLLLMEFGYTVTFIPVAVSVVLAYTVGISTRFMMISYYLSMFNGLVNFLVYSARDSDFQIFIKRTFGKYLNRRQARRNFVTGNSRPSNEGTGGCAASGRASSSRV